MLLAVFLEAGLDAATWAVGVACVCWACWIMFTLKKVFWWICFVFVLACGFASCFGLLGFCAFREIAWASGVAGVYWACLVLFGDVLVIWARLVRRLA